MNVAGLVLVNFKRHRLRIVLTMLSITVAFVLFGYLSAIRRAFVTGVNVAGRDRLIVRHKVSIIQPLPESYEREIEQIDGVEDATPATWFGGVYQGSRRRFAQLAVKPREFLAMFPEFELPKKEVEAWMHTKTGAIVGRRTAERFGWKVGDKVPIQATVWRSKSGNNSWVFDIVGIYDGARQETDTTRFLFRYDYFNERRAFGQGRVGWYYIRVSDPDRAAEIAKRIDERFANSSYETKTEPEGAFVKGFAEQAGNIGLLIISILTIVFFTILLVAGNTMAQSVRERTRELGVLKAIGFTDAQVVGLVLGESSLIAIISGAAGLALAWFFIARGDPTGGALRAFYFPVGDLALGIVLVVLLGGATGLLPALQAMRLDTVEALRRE